MDSQDLQAGEGLGFYERGWIAGWLFAQGIANPTFEEFREALFAMIFAVAGIDGPMH